MTLIQVVIESAAIFSPHPFASVIGIDDAPFAPEHNGPVPVVGAHFTRRRLTGVLIGAVEKDGLNATDQLVALIGDSKFAPNLHLVLLQGITLGGFNVVDGFTLHERLGVPVLVVARRQPDFPAIQQALLTHIPGGAQKWASIARLGPMEPVGQVYVQRVGITLEAARAVVLDLCLEGHIPEPLRVAHLIAGALGTGQSRGRV